ncbi:uncharacterized protein LOC108164844 [Drosophila miranda]|uniref:uncharacterized protein LOC108164844 n=1 Tax=Drosophila miranda TaxID=7229 RepID=UPI0007E75E98|nr:uncharacterized protein LOC108164844 [Drosophila miranda]
METQLEKVLSDIVTQPDTVGALLANRQGLCLGAKGDINPNVSGIGMAISDQVAGLEPRNAVAQPEARHPTICLYSGNRRCVIQRNGEITGVIYKQHISAPTSD